MSDTLLNDAAQQVIEILSAVGENRRHEGNAFQ